MAEIDREGDLTLERPLDFSLQISLSATRMEVCDKG